MNSRGDILYIEIEDMKHRYRNPKHQKKRINAFVQALIVNYPGLHIAFCIKHHNIAEFILKGESLNGEENTQPVTDEEREFVKKYLYGEICAPENNRKYVPSKKPSREAWAEMPTDTQRELQQQQQVSRHSLLTEEALEKHDLKSGPVELRQFACLPCNNSWWRTVLKTKPVSRCKGTMCDSQRYDALPRDKEFGIGRFLCPNPHCGRKFFGHCEATDMLTCRKCGTPSKPHIHPKWIKRARKRRQQQQRTLNPEARTFKPALPTQQRPEDVGPHFYPLSQYDLSVSTIGIGTLSLQDSPTHLSSVAHPPPPPMPLTTSIAPMPTRRKKKRVFNPSMPHIPTGSTASTFLSQCDFEKMGTEVDLDYDDEIDEYAVGACKFECKTCNNEYTSLVRMVDTAPCFRCDTDNNPLHWAPPREIEHRTTNQHSCSRCPTMGECPNLQEARFKMED